jgi:hypothetical protein
VQVGLFWLWSKKKMVEKVNKTAGTTEHNQVVAEL